MLAVRTKKVLLAAVFLNKHAKTPSRFLFCISNTSDNWQYKPLWYDGEPEYHYQLNEKIAFSFIFIPGFPNLISLSTDLR